MDHALLPMPPNPVLTPWPLELLAACTRAQGASLTAHTSVLGNCASNSARKSDNKIPMRDAMCISPPGAKRSLVMD